MAGLLQVQLEGRYAEWLGYCRFSLRVVMLNRGGIESLSFEGTYRLRLLAT